MAANSRQFDVHPTNLHIITVTITTAITITQRCQTSVILRRIGQRAQNLPSRTELTKHHRNCKILQIIFTNIALSLALTAATARAKHFGVKLVKYFTVMCINAAVTGSQIPTVICVQ